MFGQGVDDDDDGDDDLPWAQVVIHVFVPALFHHPRRLETKTLFLSINGKLVA